MSMSKAYVQAPDSERDYEDVPPSSYHATHAPPPPPSGGGEARMLSIEEIEKRRMRANWFRIIVSLVTIIVWLCAGATVFWLIEGEAEDDQDGLDWSWSNSFYFAAVTLTTVGYGDFFPQDVWGKLINVVFIMGGLGIISVVLSAIARGLVSGFERRIKRMLGDKTNGLAEMMKSLEGIEEDTESTPLMSANEEKLKRSALLDLLADDMAYFIALVAFIILIFGGGLAFWLMEDHMGFWDSCYFSVITLTTVGYGDLVPTSTGSRIFLVFYAVIGLGVFAFLLTETGYRLARRFTAKRAPEVAYTMHMEDLWEALQNSHQLLLKVRPQSRMHMLVRKKIDAMSRDLGEITHH